MKAILIVCLLFASIFFIPSSNAAEEKCDPYSRSRRSCSSKPPAQPLKPVAPPLKPPTPPTPAQPLKPVAPPLKPPPPARPPYKRRPRSNCDIRSRYKRCRPPTP